MATTRRDRGLGIGLLVAGLLWTVSTVGAALILVGPGRSAACPADGGFRLSDDVSLSVRPFGPQCAFSAGDGTSYVAGPAPIWQRAVLAGIVTTAAGLGVIVWSSTRRPVSGAGATDDPRPG